MSYIRKFLDNIFCRMYIKCFSACVTLCLSLVASEVICNDAEFHSISQYLIFKQIYFTLPYAVLKNTVAFYYVFVQEKCKFRWNFLLHFAHFTYVHFLSHHLH